ncbi:hypothetical protein [Pseudomonas parafulva]|uniref:hypothetical protein n=1 Tax=Pseudomonas parafulva TaxID=157782 RepID=UPI001F07987D|nr:hypothetical protein [Pseudomonas parafulva]
MEVLNGHRFTGPQSERTPPLGYGTALRLSQGECEKQSFEGLAPRPDILNHWNWPPGSKRFG